MSRVPADAFDTYVSMGPGRSYEALARALRLSKRTVTRLATKEQWQERLLRVEQEARDRAREKLAEGLEAINARHLKIVRAIQGKALSALQSMALDSPMDAIRALDLAIKQERVILGEPSERTAVDVEQVCRDEYRRWMKPADHAGESWETLEVPERKRP